MSRIGKLTSRDTKGCKDCLLVTPLLSVQGPNGSLSRQIMSNIGLTISRLFD